MKFAVELGQEITVQKSMQHLITDRVASRLANQDATLWGEAAEPEARIRLGWTDASETAGPLLDAIDLARAELLAAGIDRIVLCGMGGSSLAPEVITRAAGVPLVVLDSTHPAQVRAALAGDLGRTAVVVSSKSGSTIETRSHRSTFDAAFRAAGIDPSERIIVVTDPGSPLEADARGAGQRVFLADPNVGGRYSALTAFGLVPSGLAGADVRQLVAEAESIRGSLTQDDDANPALQLAAALFDGLPAQYACALLEIDEHPWGLGDWAEQLVAESTGKSGVGVLPVVLDARYDTASPDLPQEARLVTLSATPQAAPAACAITASGALGAQMLVWETATAVLGRLMQIDPFNQPDVESAKVAARSALDEASGREDEILAFSDLPDTELLAAPNGDTPSTLAELLANIQKHMPEGGYLSIQAYLNREDTALHSLGALRSVAERALRSPTTFGWGPRFLHSTGQLHKGGPQVGAFLQLLDTETRELDIPGEPAGFGALIGAQALGDRNVLIAHGAPVWTLRCSDPAATGRALIAAFEALTNEARA